MPSQSEQTAVAAVATVGQRHLWWFDRFYAHDGTYNIPFGVRLSGPIDEQLLRTSLQALVARHETLRTRFAEQQGELLQIIEPAGAVELPAVDVPQGSHRTTIDAIAARLAMDAAEPFDLQRGPLLRTVLYRCGAGDAVLGVVVHHTVFDGWSVGIFVRELAAIYAGLVAGKADPLPELPIQFADFAEWHERHATERDGQAAREYWRRQLADAPGHIDLPIDHPRQSTTSRRGGLVRRAVDHALDTRLRELAQRQRTTLNTVLLSTFGVLISRYAGQRDVLIGTPVAGRTREEVESLIGFFVKTVLIRIRRDEGLAFREMLARVGQTVLDAQHHQDTPLDDINAILAGRGTSAGLSVLQVVFALQHAPPSPQPFDGASASLVWVHNGTAKYDLFLNAVDESGRLRLELEFDADLFDARTAERLIDSYERLLEAVAADVTQPVDRLPILSAQDRAVLDAANRTTRPYPRDATVPELLSEIARRQPLETALRCDGAHITFDELDRRATHVAHSLRTLGVTTGACVGVAFDRSVELVLAVLGVLKAGAAYVPLDLTYPAERLAFMMADTNVKVVLTADGRGDALPAGPRALALAELEDTPVGRDLPLPMAGPTDLAYVMFTSGSTGRPKGVGITHRNIVRLVREQTYIRWDGVHAVLHMAPIAFDASTFELWGPLLNGKPVVIYPERQIDLDRLGAVLRRDNVDCVWLTAALFNTIVDSRPEILAGVRQLLVGGEALSAPHVRRAQAVLRETQIINGYGPTECTTFACCFAIPRPWPGHASSIPIGGPIANTLAYVLDSQGQEVPVGVAGELFLGGDGLGLGYVNQPDLTEERFVNMTVGGRPTRLYRTGDRVRWRYDGTLDFLGRLDRQVKIRGFRIELPEIEHHLSNLSGVGQAAAIVREDVAGERRIVAYVALRGNRSLSPADIKTALESQLPAYMVPSAVVILDRLPETSNGKVDRDALPIPALGTGDQAASDGAMTPLERDLAAIWRDTLGVDRVGRADNFFDLGGHSLRAIQLCVRVKDVLGVELPFSRVLQYPTVASLAEAIERDRNPVAANAAERAITPLRVTGNRPPIFFTHGVGGEVWSFAALTRHLGDDQPVYGLLPLPDHQQRPVGIAEMAARYVAEIRQVAPNGPYLLAGHCSGAAVAFEIAQQLSAAGCAVDLLAVLDYSFFDTSNRRWLPRTWQVLRNLPLWLADDLLRVGWKTAMGRLGSHVRVWAAEAKAQFAKSGSAGPDIRDRLGMWRFPEYQATALEQAYRRFQEYRPAPYEGDVLLVTPRAQPLFGARQSADLGWRRVVRGTVTVKTIKGSHETMLHEPFVAELAQVLRLEADLAESRRQRQERGLLAVTEPATQAEQ